MTEEGKSSEILAKSKMPVTDEQKSNLKPVVKGEQRAMQGDKPKTMKWTARIDNDNEEVATRLLAEQGSQTKVINYLLRQHL